MYDENDFIASCLNHRDKYECQKEEIRNRFRQGSYYYSGDKKLFKPYRSRVAEIVLYPDCEQHWIVLKDLLKEINNPFHYRFGMIIHDSDLAGRGNYVDDICEEIEGSEDFIAGNDIIDISNDRFKKLHVHLLVRYGETKTNTAIAKMYGIDSSHVILWSDLESRLFYLVHRDRDDKFGYNPEHVIGPLGGEFLKETLTKESIDPLILFKRLRKWLDGQDVRKYVTLTDYHNYLNEIDCLWFCTSRFDKPFYGELQVHNNTVDYLLNKDNSESLIKSLKNKGV